LDLVLGLLDLVVKCPSTKFGTLPRTPKNAGEGTLQAPLPTNPKTRVWEGHIPKEDYKKCLLIRNAHITASGKLDKETLDMVIKLNCSHGTTLAVQDEKSEQTPSSLFTTEHFETLRFEKVSQQLFNYSPDPSLPLHGV
jgi:hypothetical protein